MNNNWFESRGLRVLNYQQDAIGKVQESMSQREISVLAAAPSAGKTLMTIYIIEEYLKQNPTHKVQILAHGTTILRTQFHDVLEEIKPNFTYNLVEKFNQYDVTADVNVCLPQTLAGNELNKINLLVVDEAHQFYFAEKMMKEIIKKTKPQKQLLLTGTPSPFIRKGFKIIPVTLNTIFDEGMITDLFVEIATSSYSFDPMYDFNPNTDELKSSVHIKESETKKTLDDLITKIVDRLKSIKDNQYQNLLPEWLPTLKKLQKTMIACRSQHQAMQVQHYFEKIGVKSALSISDIDYNSSEIERFKSEPDCLILIVVGRGILGFNYPELVNVVDMTTSQNVDRIYQLLCRVIRKHPEGQKKLFFKIAPNIHSDYYKYIMTAVLSLSDESFFTKFNGKNFNEMIIPVIKTKREHHEPSNNGGGKPRPKTLKPIDFEGLPVFEFFKDLYHKKDALLHVYAYTTIRDVRAEFMNFKPSGYWTFEKCMESASHFTKSGDWFKNDSGAYTAAIEKKWFNECTKHMTKVRKPNGFWSLEKCKESALKYNTKNEWRLNDNKALNAALINGWYDECVKHMSEVHTSWTKEKCIESAQKYNSKIEWLKNDANAYSAACRNNWLDECTSHMKKLTGFWTLETCKESALKYNTIKDWSKNESGAYNKATKNGWIDECCGHMTRLNRKPYTKEECIENAKNYTKLFDWRKENGNLYAAVLTNGWLEECTSHMTRLVKKRWTFETCKLSAQKYNTRREWFDGETSAYNAARINKWLDECCIHMT
jgi:superfamily II DNA or RNA helicase